MRIEKTIKGEKTPYRVQIIPNTMSVEVRFFISDEVVIGIIDKDFKYILLPETFLSPYITDVGRVKVGKLKIPKNIRYEFIELNQNNPSEK